MTAKILTFVPKQKIWRTPWGHEFSAYGEAKAFIDGMTYMADCVSSHAEFLMHRFKDEVQK